MAVSPDKTLILILENKAAFLSFIDLIDNPEGEMMEGDTQIPIPFYNRTISELASRMGRVDARRLVDALSKENLDRNGFLLDLNKNEGYLTLKPWLMDMLRHLDDSRLKELTDKNLNDLRSRLANLVDTLTDAALPRVMGHPDFMEAIALMFKTLNEVNDSLQQNVQSLDAHSKRLSEILDSEEVLSMALTRQRREALEKVHVLQERNIKPMLQFIDETQDYKDKKNPIVLIQKLESSMELSGFPKYKSRLINTRIRILSHGKKVKAIYRLLQRYIRQDMEERVRYNAIEDNFNKLLYACRGVLRDGNQKTRYLSTTHEVFDTGRSLWGLKTHSQTARSRLSWRYEAEYDKFLEEKVRAYRESVLKRIDKPKIDSGRRTVRPVDSERARRSAQVRRLVGVLKGFIYTGPETDAYRVLHDYLQVSLKDYWLGDLVEAMPLVKAAGHYRITYQRSMNSLSYNGYKLRYLSCMMEPLP